MKTLWGAGVIAVAAIVVMTGCAASPAGVSTAGPSASAAPPSQAATAPLACTELAEAALLDAAVQSTARPAEFERMRLAARGYDELTSYAVQAAGGLSCAWVTASAPDPAEAPWLEVALLPNAPETISPYVYGDGPTDATRTIGDRAVTASCGDPGCGVVAVVNGTWVDIRLNIPGFGTTGGGMGSVDTVFANLSPAIAAVFDTIEGASPERMAWAPTSTLTAAEQASRSTGAAACESYLPSGRLAAAADDPSLVWEAWEEPSALSGITDLAASRAGIVKCHASSATTSSVHMQIAPGNAWIAGHIGTNPRQRLALTQSLLPGQIDTEATFSDCAASGDSPCTAVFSLGSATIEVSGSPSSLVVAEAVTSLAR